tara:strand:- start:1860 stop:2297 length:438 start_codon:yes stop_codon:yes gene_type:complete
MGKRILSYGNGGSVEQIQEVPGFSEALDHAATLPVNFHVPMRQTFEVADGVTGNVGTWIAPYACKVIAGGGYKTNGNGGAGDFIELNTSAPVAVVTWDLNVNDKLPVGAAVDDAAATIAAGTTLTVKRTQAGDCAANVFFDVIPA